MDLESNDPHTFEIHHFPLSFHHPYKRKVDINYISLLFLSARLLLLRIPSPQQKHKTLDTKLFARARFTYPLLSHLRPRHPTD